MREEIGPKLQRGKMVTRKGVRGGRRDMTYKERGREVEDWQRKGKRGEKRKISLDRRK